MGFQDILGQASALDYLQEAVAHQRIPSAYLFSGPHHTGKTRTALALAEALNCAESPGLGCGACATCRRIAAGVHPDVETVQPSGQFIRIDQIRQLEEMLALIPKEAKKRVVILSQAEQLNTEAANALLKTLEEPPADTLLILCALAPAQLPETLVSRCIPLRFKPLPVAVLRKLLSGRDALQGSALDFAVHFGRGSLRPELLEHATLWLSLRTRWMELANNCGRETPDPTDWEDLIKRSTQGNNLDFVLEWLETWYRDLALLNSGAAAARLVNQDCAEELKRWPGGVPQALECYDEILKTRRDLRLNVNKSLALEALWITVTQITRSVGDGLSSPARPG